MGESEEGDKEERVEVKGAGVKEMETLVSSFLNILNIAFDLEFMSGYFNGKEQVYYIDGSLD